MKRSIRRLLALLSGTVIANTALAQDTTARARVKDPAGEWATGIGLSVRKAFDGTKAEQAPATLLWVYDAAGDDREYSLIDIAVKFKEVDLMPNNRKSMYIVFPHAEYHRQTQESKAVNTAAIGLKAELRPFRVALSPVDGEEPFPGAGKGLPVVPLLVADGKLGRDFKAEKSTQRLSALVTLFSNKAGWPGAVFRDSRNVPRGRYYPYVGVERHSQSVDGDREHVTFGLARLYADWWPIASLDRQYFQLTGEGTYRHHLSGDLVGTVRELSFGANLFVDGRGHLGFGIEYVRGEDPNQAFAFRERTSFGIKVLL